MAVPVSTYQNQGRVWEAEKQELEVMNKEI